MLSVAIPGTMTSDESSSSDAEKRLLVLFALFRGLLQYTFSGDVVSLAVYHTEDTLASQMDSDEVRQLAREWIVAARRRPSPIDEMFDQRTDL